MLGADAGLAVPEHDDGSVAAPVGVRREHARRGGVADDGQRRVVAQERGRRLGAGGPFEHRVQRLGLGLALGQQDDLAGGVQRP